MSVLIKGMKMPMNCDECPLGEYEDSEWFSCSLMNMAYRHMAHCDRLDDCPLVELPEKHGRLIDADALVPDICHDWNGWRVPPDDYSEECIRKAPTVIEAEGEK